MLSRHARLLERASILALTSTERAKHGVIIAKGNRVLSVGVNRSRNIPTNVSLPKEQAAVHAEVAALKALPSTIDYSKLTLYSARVLRNGQLALAKPCSLCQSVLDFIGLTDIYWTGE